MPGIGVGVGVGRGVIRPQSQMEPPVISGALGVWAYPEFDPSSTTIEDQSGNGNHITIPDNTERPTHNGTCFTFDVVSDRIVIPAACQVSKHLAFTFVLVFKSPANGGSLLYSEGDGGSTEWMLVERRSVNNANTIATRMRRTTATSYDRTTITAEGAAPHNTWKMLTYRRNGTNADISLNKSFSIVTESLLGSQPLPAKSVCYLNQQTGGAQPPRSGLSAVYQVHVASYVSNAALSTFYDEVRDYLASQSPAVNLPE